MAAAVVVQAAHGVHSFAGARPARFSGANAPKIDYKDAKLLQRYVSERGKIVPSRITAVSAKKQRSWRRRSSGRGSWACCPT